MAEGMEITDSFHLYSFFASSCCQRIIIAAHLKSIALTFSFIDLAADQHLDHAYQQTLNPSRSVPTLVVTRQDGTKTIIRQSVSILEYLEERFPAPTPLLPPRDMPEARALVRDFVNIITTDVAPPTNARITERVRAVRGERDDQHAFAEACFADGFRAYEALLTETWGEAASGAFTVGEAVTMADVCLVPTIDQAFMYKMDLSFVPQVQKLYETLKAMPAFQAADWRKQPDTPDKFHTTNSKNVLIENELCLDISYTICTGLITIQTISAELRHSHSYHDIWSDVETKASVLLFYLQNIDSLGNLRSVFKDVKSIAGRLELLLTKAGELQLEVQRDIDYHRFPRLKLHSARFSSILRSPETCKRLKADIDAACVAIGARLNPLELLNTSAPYDHELHAFANRSFDAFLKGCDPGQEIRLRLGTLEIAPPADDDRSLDILFQSQNADQNYWISLRLHSQASHLTSTRTKRFTKRIEKTSRLVIYKMFSRVHKLVAPHVQSHTRSYAASRRIEDSWRKRNAIACDCIHTYTKDLPPIFKAYLLHFELEGSKRWLVHKFAIVSTSEYHEEEYSLDVFNWNETDRLKIALQLAHALSYYYESGWLTGRWTQANIIFTRFGTRIPCKPWLKISMKDTPRENLMKPTGEKVPELLELGVMLLELELGQRIEQFLQLEPAKTILERWAQADTTFYTMIGNGHTGITLEHNRRAIEFCLQSERMTNSQLLREAIYNNVVLPLQAALLKKVTSSTTPKSWDSRNDLAASLPRRKGVEQNQTLNQRPAPDSSSSMSGRRQPPEPRLVISKDRLVDEIELFTIDEAMGSDQKKSDYLHRAAIISDYNSSHRASDDWLNGFKKVIRACNEEYSASAPRVKVALLDTGIDMGHDFFDGEYPDGSIKSIRSWVDGGRGVETPHGGDECGHGTFVANLLLELNPNIDLYVARVTKSGNFEGDFASEVADALRYARDVWDVDMVNLSVGFPKPIKEIEDQINRMTRNVYPEKSILVFAAASNDGLNSSRMFPAQNSSVFAIHSTSAKGIKSDFNPSPQNDANLSTLGEHIESAWLTTGGSSCCTRRGSGTSYATAIAVCTAAFLLVNVPRMVPDHDSLFFKINTYDGMQRLLQALVVTDLADQTSRYQYMALERFFSPHENTREAIVEIFRKALSR